MNLPKLKMRSWESKLPIIQGGMGIGLSTYKLAGHVAKEGGVGIISSAALKRQVSRRLGRPIKVRDAVAEEVRAAKKISGPKGIVGMNIMVALLIDYEKSVLGSLDGGADIIISGAGLPLKLPSIVLNHPRASEVALVPIVSSGRALEIVLRRWSKTGRMPDAVIVEGPLAGGHLGWKTRSDVLKPEHHIDIILEEVFETLRKREMNIPVIPAGGIYTHEDIKKYINMGCSGVQMGTRFLATYESGASVQYKKEIVNCTQSDIVLADEPGSPCGLPFRVIKQSPFYMDAVSKTRPVNCSKGLLLNKGACDAKESNEKSFCICNGLIASSTEHSNPEEKELFTIGASGWRIKTIISVHDLMKELKGEVSQSQWNKESSMTL